jgi:spore coat protein U-like protein
MKLFKTTLIATALIAAGFVGNASAVTATTNFDVTITLTASCTVAADDIAFGSVAGNVASGDQAATGEVRVNCTPGTTYNVGLDQGDATGATVTARAMTGGTGSDTVGYGIYKDSGHSNNWGDTGTDRVGGTGNGADQAIPVYAQVPAAELANPAGNYADNILVTVTY